ncbi:peripheral-type benzodiazepine receptor-associated protein 1 isoform X2 [Lepisosteus oculatus]|uniref:peripheral-type benzodiazepine receptor-associated protein 1 isoform X2 n=1 Tax=Lepisosteus oculatus TaxID=7918 RepID=UPI003717C7A1
MGKDGSNGLLLSSKKGTCWLRGERGQEIEKLKAALEVERGKSRQAHRRFASELQRLRAKAEKEHRRVVEELTSRHDQQKELELQKLKEALAKEREVEIRQLLRSKDEELRKIGVYLEKERETAVKHARDLQRQLAEELIGKCSSCRLASKRAPSEPACLSNRDTYHKLEQLLQKLRWETDGEQAALIRRLRVELDLEKNLFLRHLLEVHSWVAEEDKTSRQWSLGWLQGHARPAEESMHNYRSRSLPRRARSKDFSPGADKMARRESRSLPQRMELDKNVCCSTPVTGSSPNSLSNSQSSASVCSRISFGEKQMSLQHQSSTESAVFERSPLSQGALPNMDTLNGTDYGYLVRQNSELLRALDELEKTCAKLREENSLLRKSSSPETEEKVKRLKRKNAELAVIAKRLEERARKLQEANLKVVNAPALVRGGGVEQYKRAFARQRARDLAQHADTLLSKDKEIAALQQECRALQARLGQGKGSPGLLATSEFETLLRESQKEVLRLQRQLSVSSAKEPASGTGQEKAQSENPSPVTDEGPRPPEDTSGLEEQRPSVTPEALSSQPEDQRLQELESELSKKRKECESLEHEVKKRQRKCLDLEHELEDVRGKHASLEEEARRLRLKAQLLKQVQANNDELRDSLSTVTAQRNSALQENQRLQAKLENLEQVLKHMREVAERRQQLELEHEEALTILKLKQEEVKRLQKAQVAAKKEHEGVVQLLEDLIQLVLRREMVKVQELEEKCRSQSEQFGLLSHELERFRLQAAKFDLLSSSLDPPSPLTNGLELSGEKDSYGSWDVITLGDVSFWSLDRSSSPFSDISLEDLEVTPPAAHTALAAEPAKEQPLEAEELSVQHQEQPTASSTNSEPEPAAGTPKPDSRQLPPKSESLPHSTPKSCPTPEVDTASEVEELDIDVSPIPEPENRAPAKLQVFIARYSYNPFDGPNENPEAELPLTAGEYIYVYGDMDEDGFYEGELMDGRRGLVPSNFVERISDDDMLSFHPPEVSDLSHNSFQESSFHSSSEKHLRLSIHSTEKTDPSVPEEEENLSGLGKVDSLMSNGFDLDMEEVGDDAVPYPRKLTLIKQLAKSIIIGWDPPLVPAGWGNVWSYNVYVDKELRLNVPFGSQTKAVLERLDVNLKAYRVSVQSVTEKGDSDQLRCSILVGRDVCVAPTQLKVESTTATSASLAWLPSNSNYVHAVFLNDEECEIVKAGCYSHCLSNLRPNLRYRVKVEARPHRTPWELPLDRRERKCAVTSFITLTAGPPDAPLDVQVELGPSPGIALVSWLPVTIDAAGTSNGVRVTGYAIYADKQKVLEVASPTAGSVLVGPSQMHILQAAQELTVRTMSTYGESTDSVPVKIPAKLFAATAPCQPLPTPPSASSLLEVSMHSTTATAPLLLASALRVEPPVALAAREASVPTFPKANLGDGVGAALHREERTESVNSLADSLPAAGASTSSLILHEGSSVSNFHLGHTVDITSSSGTGRLLDSTKDSESVIVKRPSVSITDFLEEAVSSADPSSSVAEMSVESSQGLPGESAGRTEDQVPSGSHSHCLDTSGQESEHEAEEESSHGNVRVVSMDEFLDHNLQKTGLGNIPSHQDPYLRPKEDPVNDHRLSEYQTESSRGSDLSDILEEDEEDLCSDALGTEEGEEQSGGLGVGDGSKPDTWETDSDEEILEKILKLPLQTHHSKQLFSIPEVTEEEDESQELEDGESPDVSETPHHGSEKRPTIPETFHGARKLASGRNPTLLAEANNHSEANDRQSSGKFKEASESLLLIPKPHSSARESSPGCHPMLQVCEKSGETKDPSRYSVLQSRSKQHSQKTHLSAMVETGNKASEYQEEDFDSGGSVYIHSKEPRMRRCHEREPKDSHLLAEKSGDRLRREALLQTQRDHISSELLKSGLHAGKYYSSRGGRGNNASVGNGVEIDIEYGTEDDEEALVYRPAAVHLGQMHAGWWVDGTQSEGPEELSDCSSPCESVTSEGRRRELKRQGMVEDEVFESKSPSHHHHPRYQHQAHEQLHGRGKVGASGTVGSRSRGRGGPEAGEGVIRGQDFHKTAGRRARPEHGAKGHSSDDSHRETSAEGDPRLPHSAEAVSWRGLNGFSPKMDHLETRPAKDAPRAETPEATECSEVEGLAADSTVRIFVALFQYDPAVMSPNPDAAEEELPFKEGQIIKIYGDKDADGFYRGESGGRLGYVPCNMVSEIQVEDEETRDQLLQQGFLSAEASMEKIGTRSHAQLPRRPVPPPKPRRSRKVESAGVWEESVGSSRERSWPGSGPHSVAPRKMVAIFDYDPRESSPNVDIEAELTFSAGDIIVVFGDMDDDGFFYGESNGQQGLVPSNFLQAIPDKGVEAPGSVCEEKGLSESRRESQVSLAPSEEQNESPVATVEEVPDPSSALNIVLPQVMTPEAPNQSETSPQGKKKKGFFSKGKKLFKKLGSSKKE